MGTIMKEAILPTKVEQTKTPIPMGYLLTIPDRMFVHEWLYNNDVVYIGTQDEYSQILARVQRLGLKDEF